MKTKFWVILGLFTAPLSGFASNEGVPVFYNKNTATNANRNAYAKYQKYGYTDYVGNTGQKQIIASNQYSYKVPKAGGGYDYINYQNGAMTTNGIGMPVSNYKSTIYANYTRRFADFEFETGVNSILEWDDMIFNEINVGLRHVFDLHGFDLLAYGDYTYGKLSKGGLSMDYDLEPYDYAYPEDGIFTISMGGQSGDTNKLKLGIGAHHIWDWGGWKITPHIGYEIFKHNLEMDNHIYPNPGVYLPVMTSGGDYVFYDTIDNTYWAISPNNVSSYDDNIFYQVCMSPEDIKIVYTSISNGQFSTTPFITSDYNPDLGTVPWGVGPGDCVVIGGDGMVKVDGTTHIYNTTWSGFYLGLEIEKQMTLVDKLRFYAQISMPKYSAEGIWPNRDDWQQSPSFLDEGTNGSLAYELEMEYTYQISDRLQLSLKANTDYFHIGSIPGELYVAKQTYYEEDESDGNWIIVEEPAYTEYVSESLKKATWQSFGLYLGVKYSF